MAASSASRSQSAAGAGGQDVGSGQLVQRTRAAAVVGVGVGEGDGFDIPGVEAGGANVGQDQFGLESDARVDQRQRAVAVD